MKQVVRNLHYFGKKFCQSSISLPFSLVILFMLRYFKNLKNKSSIRISVSTPNPQLSPQYSQNGFVIFSIRPPTYLIATFWWRHLYNQYFKIAAVDGENAYNRLAFGYEDLVTSVA